MAITVGGRAKVTATFTNTAGAVADPSAVVAKVRTPAGVITTYTYGVSSELTKTSTGIYVLQFDVTVQGTWQVRFTGTGVVTAAAETDIVAPASPFV